MFLIYFPLFSQARRDAKKKAAEQELEKQRMLDEVSLPDERRVVFTWRTSVVQSLSAETRFSYREGDARTRLPTGQRRD